MGGGGGRRGTSLTANHITQATKSDLVFRGWGWEEMEAFGE